MVLLFVVDLHTGRLTKGFKVKKILIFIVLSVTISSYGKTVSEMSHASESRATIDFYSDDLSECEGMVTRFQVTYEKEGRFVLASPCMVVPEARNSMMNKRDPEKWWNIMAIMIVIN